MDDAADPAARRPRRRPAPCGAFAAALAAAVLAGPAARPAVAADPEGPEVKAAIKKGVDYLRGQLEGGVNDSYGLLAALAMAKGGAPKDDPIVQSALKWVRGRAGADGYEPNTHHLYTAGLEMMLLEAAGDPDRDRPAMQAVLNYVLAQQQPYGAWFYPDQVARGGDQFFGDTSITQYALLGMWTGERAGLKVDPANWNAVAKWQVATRLPSGAFAYHPARGAANEPRDTMTAAGACNLLLAARYLHGQDADALRKKAEAEERAARDAADARAKKYAAFDRRRTPEERAEEQSKVANVVPLASLSGAADGAIGFLARVMQLDKGQERFYLLYTVERLGALSGQATFGGRDWYGEGSDWLLGKQRGDGSWLHSRTDVDTAFAVMFLSKATAKALGQPRSLYGGGLLKGGRGLPTDLRDARFDGDSITFERPTGDLSDLLSALENPAAANVPAATEAVLETVRTGDREALVGQTAKLRRLIEDPRPDVRSVVLWALARGGGPEDVGAIYGRLVEDPDAAVAREAHNALCMLARLPRGPGVPTGMLEPAEAALDRLEKRDLPETYTTNGRLRVLPEGPFAGLPAGLPDAERAAAFADWRAVAAEAWGDWRDAVKPYDQRDLVPAPKLR